MVELLTVGWNLTHAKKEMSRMREDLFRAIAEIEVCAEGTAIEGFEFEGVVEYADDIEGTVISYRDNATRKHQSEDYLAHACVITLQKITGTMKIYENSEVTENDSI